jgi:hypothetical protein
MRKQGTLLPFIVIVIVVLCSGCSLHKPISNHAVDFNLALEKAQNKLMLLNVVRSSKRQPTHYSSITQVLGSASSSLSPSLTLPLGGDATSLFPLALSASSSGGVSTVSIAALNSKEFVQGVMNPISVDQLDYYLKQGWSKELIFTLFVRKMVVGGEEYLNRPTSSFEDVDQFIEKIRSMEISIKLEKGEAVGQEFEVEKSTPISKLILSAEASGLALEANGEDPRKYRFRRKTGKKVIYLEGKRASAAHEDDPKEHLEERQTIFLRSTEGIFYYLGQLMRFQNLSDPKPKILVSDPEGLRKKEVVVFFATAAGRVAGEGEVEVSHGGVKYIIPKNLGVEHRSMAVLSLLNQLIGLNKSRAETPTTGVVTVAGG